MLKVILAAVAALCLAGSDTADAASKPKAKKMRVHPPTVIAPMKSPVTRRPGPSWAGPNDCYTDEGYGRYLQCGAGMDM